MVDLTAENARIIEEFRANDGSLGGMLEGAQMLLLHTTGAKSGKERVAPLMYQQHDDGYAVFASKAGAASNPAWYHNLRAKPSASIEVGADTITVAAREITGHERDRIWERQKADVSLFADYEKKTERTIPVILLQPIGS